MKKIIAKRWRVSAWDLVKSVLIFFGSTFADLIVQWATTWGTDHTVVFDFQLTLRTSLIATIVYFLKQWTGGGKTGGEIRPLVLIGFLLSSVLCFGQKPAPKPDTIEVIKGSIHVIDLFANDVGTNKIVTSFKVKTSTYTVTTEKEVSIAGIGKIKINRNGLATFTSIVTYLGAWPEIQYIENSIGLTTNGVSAKIVATTVKQKDTSAFHNTWSSMSDGRVALKNCLGNIVSIGEIVYDELDGEMKYFILFPFPDQNETVVHIINKKIYDFLTGN